MQEFTNFLMAVLKNLLRAFLVVISFLLISVTFVLLSVKMDRGGMFVSYWLINTPLFVAYAVGLVWLGVELFFLTDVLAARLKIGGVWVMLMLSLASLFLLTVRFERMRDVPYWVCLMPLYVGFSAAVLMLVVAIYKTKDVVYDPSSGSFHYVELKDE